MSTRYDIFYKEYSNVMGNAKTRSSNRTLCKIPS